MIKELKELVVFFDRSNSRQLERSLDHLSVKCKKLYEVILELDEVTDLEAAQSMYKTSPNSAYFNLRRRLYYDLLEILLIKYPEMDKSKSTYDGIRDHCINQAAAVRVLQTKGLRKNLVYLSEKTLKISLKYDLNDINVELLKVLLDIYGCTSRDKRKFTKYLKLYRTIEEVRMIEDKIQVQYYEYYSSLEKINNDFYQTNSHNYIDVPLLEKQIHKNLSFKVSFFAYNILCLHYLVNGEFEKLKSIANQGYFYVKSAVQKSNRLSMFFLDRRLTAEINLNQRPEIWLTIQEIELWISKKSNTYFVIGIYKALMNLHDRAYQVAFDEVVQLRMNSFFEELPKSISEYIELIYAYLNLLIKAEVFDVETKVSFRIYKFLNNIPGYQKDKRGANISILILHIMFLLEGRKTDKIIDRIEALRLYSYRYLRKNSTFRSNCYIKMLIQMTKANFHPIRTELYTNDLLKKLKSVPVQISEQPLEIEIIPYEDLWEITLQLLERNSKIRRGRPRKENPIKEGNNTDIV